MRKIAKVFIWSMLFGFVLIACNTGKKKEHEAKQEQNEKTEHAAHDDKAESHDHGYEMAMNAYQCPMKCEGDKTYKEEGICPECKMDLKKVDVASNDESGEEDIKE